MLNDVCFANTMYAEDSLAIGNQNRFATILPKISRIISIQLFFIPLFSLWFSFLLGTVMAHLKVNFKSFSHRCTIYGFFYFYLIKLLQIMDVDEFLKKILIEPFTKLQLSIIVSYFPFFFLFKQFYCHVIKIYCV